MGSTDAILLPMVQFLMADPNNPLATFVVGPLATLIAVFGGGATF
jgi:hypothetical protein